ncbi:MAG: glycosyltransferase [Sedimentisphaerales bacterium]|nr:glycosyltransferase [Sedimentisphaerales bacterium]
MNEPDRNIDKKSRVTVVIPTYNAADYIGAAIQSALQQSFEDFELLVLDNVSTDNTADIVARFNDPRLHYRTNEQNIGFLGNANLGLSLARGEYLTYLGADDIWEKDFLLQAVALMDNNQELSFVHGSALWIDEKSQPFGGTDDRWQLITDGNKAFVDTFRYGFCFSTMLMRTETAQRIGPLPQDWGDLADTWLFLRMALEGDVGYLFQTLVLYRVHKESLSLAWYKNGKLFLRHLELAREVFNWERSRQVGVDRHKRKGLRAVALQSVTMMPIIRNDGSRRALLKTLAGIVAQVPEVLFFPRTWLRVAFGMLPRKWIFALRNFKHRRWQQAQLKIQNQQKNNHCPIPTNSSLNTLIPTGFSQTTSCPTNSCSCSSCLGNPAPDNSSQN